MTCYSAVSAFCPPAGVICRCYQCPPGAPLPEPPFGRERTTKAPRYSTQHGACGRTVLGHLLHSHLSGCTRYGVRVLVVALTL